jgi:quercetin dioxygenase-like cupin family protein
MRRLLTLITGFAAAMSIAAFAQGPQPAPGTQAPAASEPRGFIRDPSGWLSRIVFESDDNPDFKITIREFSFPPQPQAHTVNLPSFALARVVSGQAEVGTDKLKSLLSAGARTALPAGAPLVVVNNGNAPVIMRSLMLEPK